MSNWVKTSYNTYVVTNRSYMSNSLEQNEVLSLQKQIIFWLQRQILIQSNPTTIETGQMMKLLGKALDYYKTLIELEERLNSTPVERVSKEVVANSSQASYINHSREPTVVEDKPIGNDPTAEEQDESVIDKEEPIDCLEDKPARQYYSLAKTYELAVQEGFVGTQSSFRERIGRGETLFGWHKEPGLGNKPCYFRE
jgi:hypothetical protein